MKEKVWVAGGGEDVSSWVAADEVVACSVHAEDSIGEIALHQVLEVIDVVVVFDESGSVAVRETGRRCIAADIASQTAGVVAQTVCLWVGGDIA